MPEFDVDQMWDIAMDINNKSIEEWPDEAALIEMVRKDLAKPVEEWSDADKDDWRAMGYRVPRRKRDFP
jgi:hypothetical protein